MPNHPTLTAIQQMLRREEPLRWVFAGDSITHGAKHTFGGRDYVELFAERVRWEMGRSRDCIITTAISGWRITNLLEDLEWSVLQHRPHVLSVMLGMNDCTLGIENLAAFKQSYLAALQLVRQACAPQVILHTPNWTLVTGGDVRRDHLPAYAAVVREVAAESGALLVDHLPEWEAAEQTGAMHHWMGHGCHPNAYGHRVLARTLYRALQIEDAEQWSGQLGIPE